jgi:ElaB/YqjD/DUF883 family membrane-anchored ribosome-binding protein
METTNTLKETASRAGAKIAEARDKAEDLARTAAAKLDEARYATASTLEDAAGCVRTTADEMTGAIDGVAGRTAAKLDSSAAYVRNHTFLDAFTDIRGLVRRNPGPSLMIATAVGFLVGAAVTGKARRA